MSAIRILALCLFVFLLGACATSSSADDSQKVTVRGQVDMAGGAKGGF